MNNSNNSKKHILEQYESNSFGIEPTNMKQWFGLSQVDSYVRGMTGEEWMVGGSDD